MLGFLDDLESDFSVFHRVDDMYEMPARRFRVLAARIHRYDGAFRAAVTTTEGAAANAAVPATRLNYEMNPELRGVGSFAEVKAPEVLSPEQQAYIDAHPELQAPPR